MVRAPCCEKMGLKKGPWTPEEDQALIAYIQQHGHGNWRALPKHAGLLRCGKSCRLRWTNYLRPDIKRGNFSKEEEETIIKLHELLGNRWSAIAAKLPGRTDNEIKNVWHTHLKKRILNSKHNNHQEAILTSQKQPSTEITKCESSISNNIEMMRDHESDELDESTSSAITSGTTTTHRFEHPAQQQSLESSPMRSSSTEHLSAMDSPIASEAKYEMGIKLEDYDDGLWLQAMPVESFCAVSEEFITVEQQQQQLHFPPSPVSSTTAYGSNLKEDSDFWRDLFREAGELTELPGF